MGNKTALIVGLAIIFIILLAIIGSSGSNTNSPNLSDDDFSVRISNKTGESASDIKNALAVVGRYNIDRETAKVVVDNAAMVAVMTSSGKNSSQLKFLGFGDLMQTADTFAQIAQAWKFDSSTAQRNFDLLFNTASQSTIKWPQFSTALISNGPKFYGYAGFINAATALSAMSKYFPADSTVEIFDRVGDATADPKDKLNIALGSEGSIGRVVKKEGILKAVEAISNYIKQPSN